MDAETEALSVFTEFTQQMREWILTTKKMDNESYKGLIDHDYFKQHRMSALLSIFDRYVLYDDYPMRATLEGGFGYNKSEYNPQKEVVVRVDASSELVCIHTEYNDRGHIYTLIRKDGRWFLKDGRKRTSNGVPFNSTTWL